MTQRENLLSHGTGGVWKRFEGDPCKALWFHSFPAAADAGEAATSPRQHFQLAPKPRWEPLGRSKGQEPGELRGRQGRTIPYTARSRADLEITAKFNQESRSPASWW